MQGAPQDENVSLAGNTLQSDAKSLTVNNKENVAFTVPVARDQKSKNKGLEYATVVLAQFQAKPILDLGQVKVGRTRAGIFKLVNPLKEQDLVVHLKKLPKPRGSNAATTNFSFACTEWTVPASGEIGVHLEWSPSENGKVREVVEFEFTQKRKLIIQAQILGEAIGGTATVRRTGPKAAQIKRIVNPRPVPKNRTGPLRTAHTLTKTDTSTKKAQPLTQGSKSPSTAKTSSLRRSSITARPAPKQRKVSLHRGVTSTSASNKLVHYDERWQEKQERGFSNWINFIIKASSAPDGSNSNNEPSPSDSVAQLEGEEANLVDARNAHAILAQKQREASVRRRAFALYHSGDLECVMLNVEKEVSESRLVVRNDRQMYKDLGLRNHMLKILMAYEATWLKMGLETVFGEIINLSDRDRRRDSGRSILKKFLVERLLSDPEITARFRDTKRGVFENKEYSQVMQKFTLNKFLSLVAFLDQAKLHAIVEYPNCLFNPEPEKNPLNLKSSAQVVVEFAKEFLSGEGNVLKHLSHSCGFDLFHKQTPLDEFNFLVTNLAVDLRDGIRLTRMVEILTSNQTRDLSSRLRLPAVSRLQKLHNVSLALNTLEECGVDLGAGRRGKITKVDIVDGSRDKTLALLWKMIVKWRLSALVSEAELNDEIEKVVSLHGPTAKRIMTRAVQDMEAESNVREAAQYVSQGDAMGNESNAGLSGIEELLLRWCQAVCAHHGGYVSNFTTSMATGRNLCLLIHHYHPKLLQMDVIHATTADLSKMTSNKPQCSSPAPFETVKVNHSDLKEALKGERANFKLVNECAIALGCVPVLLPDFDSKNVPEPKLMSVFVAYLCARLFDSRKEIHAAMVIQKHWLLYHYRKYSAEKGAAIRTIQRFLRGALSRKRLRLARQRVERERLAQYDAAATRIQSFIRSCLAPAHVVQGRCAQVMRLQSSSLQARLLKTSAARATVRLEATVVIQTWVRMLRDQDSYLRVRFAVYTLHHFFRSVQCRQGFLAVRRDVITVQSVARGRLARKTLERMKAAIKIQASVRGFNSRRVARKRLLAVSRLQSCIRTWQMRRRMKHTVQHLVQLQANVRRRQTQCKILRFKTGVSRFQHVVRMKLQMRSQSATVIQTHYRRIVTSRVYRRYQTSSVTIQAYWRQTIARRNFRQLVDAVGVVQCLVRQKQATTVLKTKQKSLAVLQRFGRRVILRLSIRRTRSAIQIQKQFRAHQAQSRYCVTRLGVVCLQSLARRLVNRARVARQRLAATTIQNQWRARCVRRAWHEQIASVIKLQSHIRAFNAKQRLLHQHKAATLVQCQIRGLFARRSFAQDRSSVVILQSLYRCQRTRDQYLDFRLSITVLQAHFRRRVMQNKYRETTAARLLQAHFRRYQCRTGYIVARHSATAAQSFIRCILTRNAYTRTQRATLQLQSAARMWSAQALARREYQLGSSAAKVIQKHWRGFQSRAVLSFFHAAAACLQAAVRCNQQRARYLKLKASSVAVQAGYRGRRQRMRFLRVTRAVTRFQALARGWSTRKALCETRAQATRIQAIVRGRSVRAQIFKLNCAAVVAQSSWRGFSQRQSYLETRKVVEIVQSHVRRTLVQRRLAHRHKLAVKVQAVMRGAMARREFLRTRHAVIRVQTAGRMYFARRNLKQIVAATIWIQSAVRRQQSMRHVQRIRSTVKIQSFLRMSVTLLKYVEILRSVEELQRVVRGHQIRTRLEREHLAAVRLQAWVRGIQVRDKIARLRAYYLQQSSALRIQQNWRAHTFRRSFYALLATHRQRSSAASSISQWWQSRRDRMHFLRVRRIAVRLQASFRVHEGRKRVAVLVLQRVGRGMVERRRVRHVVMAAPRIQAVWRGHVVRQECDRRMNEARARLAVATKEAVAAPEKRLGNRTTHALDWLLNSSSLADILTACMTLETSTRLSDVCCDVFVREHLGAPAVIFRLIKSCNRSEPHIRLLRVALALLTNCALLPRCAPMVFAVDESAEVLVDLLQIFRDRIQVFRPTVKLLYLLKKRCPQRAKEILYGNEELTKRLHSIHHIMKRKLDIDRRLHANRAGKTKAFEALCDSYRALSNIIGKH